MKNAKRVDYSEDLLQSIEQKFGSDSDPQTLSQWVEGPPPLTLDNKPFSFRKHEYLIEPYSDNHVDQTWMKGTQLGCSTLAVLRSIYALKYLNFMGVLYCFPSQGHASDFSRSKIGPLIESNPSIAEWVKETDAINVKNISGNFLFLRGMKSRGGLKSLRSDYLVFDEWDEAEKPYEAMALAKERLGHSEYKWILRLSNPTLVDFAIDREFKLTDQRFWLLKCPACGEWTDMVGDFPNTLLEVKGRVIRGCLKCQGELDPSQGEWVAKQPSVKARRGFQFSQLWSAFVPPEEILHDFRTTDNLTEFFNLKVGIGHIEATNRLCVAQTLALCGDALNASEDVGPCSLGCDVGKLLHCVIGKVDPLCGKAARILHVSAVESWEDLSGLMKRFNVSRAVIDSLPEIHASRSFADAHPGRVFLAYYQAHRKGHPLWNTKDQTLSVDRTESLDACRHQIQTQNVVLPRRSPTMETFAQHMSALAKVLQTDAETGATEYRYIRLSDNHYAHAYTYQHLAAQRLSQAMFNI